MNNSGTPYQAPSSVNVPVIQKTQVAAPISQDKTELIKTIVIIVLGLVAVTFVGLFVWMFMEYNAASSNVNGQVEVAVAEAVDKKTEELEAEFLEREKDPWNNFSGPEDYGGLSFKYPRTWSIYVAEDGTNGTDFEAYFNPGQVNKVSDETINALRVIIQNESFEKVAEYYQSMIEKYGELSLESITVNGVAANRYTGIIPGTELNGYIVIFKIRDKTAILQTDSVLFANDFNEILTKVVFNA